MPDSKLKVFKNLNDLSKAAAEFVLQTAKDAVKRDGNFTIALSGGGTPEKLYELLAQSPYKESFPWQQTHVFWGDERCVPLDDKRNNAYNAINTLLSKVDIPKLHIHRIQSQLPPAQAAQQYANELEATWEGHNPEFDLILLGMGDDGHTASLFPGTDVLNNTTSLIEEVFVPQHQMHRITMMPRLINQARNVLFLVSGEGKSKVFGEILSGSAGLNFYPAQLIKPCSGNLLWFVDADAASDL